jgi:hypothetical protein
MNTIVHFRINSCKVIEIKDPEGDRKVTAADVVEGTN